MIDDGIVGFMFQRLKKKLKDRYLIKTFHIEVKRWKLHILDIWLILTEISYWFLMKKSKLLGHTSLTILIELSQTWLCIDCRKNEGEI